MAVQYRRVGSANIAANTRTLIYTVPTGKTAILKSLHMGNDNAGDVRMGTTLNGSGFIWNQLLRGAYDSKNWPLSTVLPAGTQVHTEHSAANCYTMLTLVELDQSAEGANLWSSWLLSVHEAARLTSAIPAGKRVRLREVVLGAHGSPGDFSVYIPNVGHPIKARVPGTEDVVVATDFVVNPGEQVGARAFNSPVAHVFLSGVLEDA